MRMYSTWHREHNQPILYIFYNTIFRTTFLSYDNHLIRLLVLCELSDQLPMLGHLDPVPGAHHAQPPAFKPGCHSSSMLDLVCAPDKQQSILMHPAPVFFTLFTCLLHQGGSISIKSYVEEFHSSKFITSCFLNSDFGGRMTPPCSTK